MAAVAESESSRTGAWWCLPCERNAAGTGSVIEWICGQLVGSQVGNQQPPTVRREVCTMGMGPGLPDGMGTAAGPQDFASRSCIKVAAFGETHHEYIARAVAGTCDPLARWMKIDVAWKPASDGNPR